MSYRCPARHTTKEDVYYFGDGIHKLYYENCCKEVVSKAGALCKKHEKRFEGEYKTKDQRLLCQWNYVFHHGLIGEEYNKYTQMYGSPYYVEGLKKGWGVPKKKSLEKAMAMQKEVLDLAISMQMKITDYIKPESASESPVHEIFEGKPEAKEGKPEAKGVKTKAKGKPGPKKRVQADQTSLSSSSSSSASLGASSSSGSSFISYAPPMYIPKGHVAYAEAEDDPIIVTAAQISTLILRASPTGGWVDEDGKHYRKLDSGIIQMEAS